MQATAYRKVFAYAVVAVLAGVTMWQFAPARNAVALAYEAAALTVDPSAERAYAYATRHFDARQPRDYDIDRAARLYETANEMDPTLRYLQHQRARIAFLKGDYNSALTLIDAELAIYPDSAPSHYVRGLVKGFAGDYNGAAGDYEAYLKSDPKNWAAINDYAWVLLKAERPLDALVAVDWGLIFWPENPWLLNSKATAHYELGQLEKAHDAVQRAQEHVASVTTEAWLRAYPGNDPLIAEEGIAAFKEAVAENMHTIARAIETGEENMR